MLRKLTVENFYSIAEEQTFDLRVPRNATDPDGRFAMPMAGGQDRFVKVAALFGANASGKTTVLRALSFLRAFIVESVEAGVSEGIPYLPFFNNDLFKSSTKIMLEFDAALFEIDGHNFYRYELEVKEYKRVILEKLYYYPLGRRRLLFSRQGKEIRVGESFGLSKSDPVLSKVRDNVSALAVFAAFDHPLSVALHRTLEFVKGNVYLLGKKSLNIEEATRYYQDYPECLLAFSSLAAKFDFGIEEVSLKVSAEGGFQPMFRHKGLDASLDLQIESEGTQNIYRLFPVLHPVLTHGGIAVIDEMDNDIHPLILPEIVRMFQSPESNPHNAQLIFSCHNATLLEHLVKEEVFFTEKDDQGRTQLYGLKDIQGVRRDTNIYAKYLSGMFGAVPRLA